MQTITTIGLDIAKSVFQVHGVDADGQVVFRRQLKGSVDYLSLRAALACRNCCSEFASSPGTSASENPAMKHQNVSSARSFDGITKVMPTDFSASICT